MGEKTQNTKYNDDDDDDDDDDVFVDGDHNGVVVVDDVVSSIRSILTFVFADSMVC